MSDWRVYRPAHFTVGQKVWVDADQSYRHGEVTQLGRTRVRVLHPRNRFGTLVERAYPMDRIVIGYGQDPGGRGWGLVLANGTWWAVDRKRRDLPDLPTVQPLKNAES